MAQRTAQRTIGLNKPGQPLPNYCVAEYDFAVDGGAVSQITLRGDTVPSGAYIDEAVAIIQTALASGGAATVSADSEAAADLNAADVITGTPWSAAGVKTLDKFWATDKGVLTTADRAIKVTIGTAALTAGKFKIVVRYWML